MVGGEGHKSLAPAHEKGVPQRKGAAIYSVVTKTHESMKDSQWKTCRRTLRKSESDLISGRLGVLIVSNFHTGLGGVGAALPSVAWVASRMRSSASW